MKKAAVRTALSLSLAGLLLVLLMLWGGVSPVDALDVLRRLPFEVYLLALGLHVVTYSMRALRLRVLLPRAVRPGFRRSLVVAAAHNMASYLLPAKTGEASHVVYLRLHCGVKSSLGLASLLVARFLDGATLCSGLAIACLWLLRSGKYGALEWLGPTSAVLATCALAFLALSLRGDLLVRLIELLLRWLRLHRWSLVERLLVKTNALAMALRTAGERGRLSVAAILTVPMWISVFAFYGVLGKGMGLPETFSFAETTFGASLSTMFNLLPVNGAAGVGTQELGWVTGFHQFLEVDYDVALASGIGVHLVQLFNIVVMGFVAHLAMGITPRLHFDSVEAEEACEGEGAGEGARHGSGLGL